MALFDEGRDVDDEAGAHIGVEAGVDDLEGAMRLGAGVDFLQAGKKAGFVAERGGDGVVGMARLPVRKDDDAGTELAQNAHDGDAIFKRIFDSAVREVERLPPANAENARGFFGFAGAIFRGAARAGFALSQIENRRAQAARSHAQQRSSAGLFHVVAMRGDGKDVGAEVDCLCGHGISRRYCRRR